MSSNPRYITPSSKYHIVEKGQTLTSIAREHNLTVRKIKIFNNLTSDRIYIGQKIYLNPKPSRKQEYITIRSIPKSGYHLATQQETLNRIAEMYDITVFDLMEFNNLSQFGVSPGTKLWLQDGHAAAITPVKSTHSSGQKPSASHTKTPQKMSHKVASHASSKKTAPPASYKPKTPLTAPTKGMVTSEFGLRNGRPHKGIDIAAAPGDPIFAVAKGKVVFAGTQRGYGNVVIIEHENMVMTVYAHNEANLVRLGELVKKGQPIAAMGSTGSSPGPHLHFEYRVQGKAINPRTVLPEIAE
jgi:murein DD-endopeptidase MepM/ murein hydrolase activator NlpD